MKRQTLFQQTIEKYGGNVLSWAVRKTGNRSEGEELAQEVMFQFFTASSKTDQIDKPEHFLWKVAHHCWCNHLREKTRRGTLGAAHDAMWDGTDFVAEYIAQEEQKEYIAAMRREISKLSFIQREAMILHYLEGFSVAETAKKLNTTESAVTWHLFDARKRVKTEMSDMNKPTTDYVYRPGRLKVGCSGIPGPDPDTQRINDSLIRQNICLLCYRESKTIDELAQQTGIPKPYLEYDLKWLTEHEFLLCEGKRYATIFPIIGKKHHQDIGSLFFSTRGELIDRVIDHLWGHEKTIRGIGFYGSDFPMERLMWAVIELFTSYVSRNSPLLARLKKRDERQIRPDGGRYYIMAGDISDNQPIDLNGYVKPLNWNGFYGICSGHCATFGAVDNYYWLGVYTFADPAYHPDIINENDPLLQTMLCNLYASVMEPDFDANSLSPMEKEKLAEAVADGLITNDTQGYKPNFVIFTPEQLKELQQCVFAPLAEAIEPVLGRLLEVISRMHKENMPRINRGYIDYHCYVDLWDFGVYTLIFAAEDKKLWLPDTPEQGTPLTLVIVK